MNPNHSFSSIIIYRASRVLALFVLATLTTSRPAYADLVIIEDSFSRTGNLDGSAPDISPGTRWISPSVHVTDGTALNMSSAAAGLGRANIGFNFVPGYVYTLSVEMDVEDVDDDRWLALGFTSNLNGTHSYDEGVYAWMLMRSAARPGADDFETWIGQGTEGGVSHELDPFVNTGSMKITIDATNLSNYEATWNLNGNDVRTASIGTPPIDGVYLSTYNGNGTFDNLRLVSSVPEPSGLALFSMIAVACVFVRRAVMSLPNTASRS